MQFVHNDLGVPSETLPEDIQGNIVSGYDRTQTDLVFLRFPGSEPESNRDLFRSAVALVPPTSAQEHHAQRKGDGTLTNWMLTASGYRKLGYERLIGAMDPAFASGARSRESREALSDPDVSLWEESFRNAWDALLLIAHGSDPAYATQVTHIVDQLSARFGKEGCHFIHGNRLDSNGRPSNDVDAPHYEPFGFRDGLSNPIFLNGSEDSKARHSMARPLSRCLAVDPASRRAFGSYFVFRKLEQDREKFDLELERLIDVAIESAARISAIQFGAAGMPGHVVPRPDTPVVTDYRQAAALAQRTSNPKESFEAREGLRDFILRRAVGRDRNGYPWTDWHRPPVERAQTPAPATDFTFDEDRDATICPMQAHVRKVNPRGLTHDPDEWRHVIARRGIPYGSIGQETGLLFLCAQADIKDQFEFIQRRWANNDLPSGELGARPTPGLDNIIARPTRPNQAAAVYETVELSSTFYECVTLRGGEYLFAPSLSGLAALADGSASDRVALPPPARAPRRVETPSPPTGLLSFLFHVTGSPAFRSEQHEDIERSFERFGVDEPTRVICRRMEQSCITLRKPGSAAHERMTAQDAMRKDCPKLFASVCSELLVTLRSLPLASAFETNWFGSLDDAHLNWLALDYVYAFCYGDDATIAKLLPRLKEGSAGNYQQELEALRRRPVDLSALQTLCAALADEYASRGWPRNW